MACTIERLFCDSCDCDIDARAALNGFTASIASEARRAWDSRCLVTGDGLLGTADDSRRSAACTNRLCRAIGLLVIAGVGAPVTNTLRSEGRVVDGD